MLLSEAKMILKKNGFIAEALRIPGFDSETQKEFDKCVSYYTVCKSRLGRVTQKKLDKLAEFKEKFQQYYDMTDDTMSKLRIAKYIDEVKELLNTPLAPSACASKQNNFVNPEGGEYWDGDVHVIEVPND